MDYEELQKNSEHWYEKYKELKKENKQLKEKVEGYEITRDRLIEIGFPTFMSCKDYTDQTDRLLERIEKMKCGQNCKHSYLYQEDRKCKFTYCDCINCKDKWELAE